MSPRFVISFQDFLLQLSVFLRRPSPLMTWHTLSTQERSRRHNMILRLPYHAWSKPGSPVLQLSKGEDVLDVLNLGHATNSIPRSRKWTWISFRSRKSFVYPWRVYHLQSRQQREIKMSRLAISSISCKWTHSVQVFLSQAIDPPSVVAIDRALTTLEELGATDDTGTLTALGKHIASLIPFIYIWSYLSTF